MSNAIFKRLVYKQLTNRLNQPRHFIQVLAGPRQIGKTTIALQLLKETSQPSHYASADDPRLQDLTWLTQQWDIARTKLGDSKGSVTGILILDEIQKIPQWSSIVKQLWDEDTRAGLSLHVVLLGSSPLLIQDGLSESLAGRFETIPITHWTFAEMHEAFDWTLEKYIYFGGYPGAALLIEEEHRWRQYIFDSLIETTLSRDILLVSRITKPALLRRLFELACHYSGQILSYQKMLGQLQDVGNATTVAHYLNLLSGAGLVTGLEKYAGQKVRQKSSSPKLQVLNTALLSAQSDLPFSTVQQNPEFWGRLVESAVGAHLVNAARRHRLQVFYWREGNYEVDFVVKSSSELVAIEVKSSSKKNAFSGMASFANAFHPTRQLLIGPQGFPVEEFLRIPISQWIRV